MTKAILYRQNKLEHEELEVNSLEDLQTAVEGHIESASWIFDDNLDGNIIVYINEEGKINGKCLPNRDVLAKYPGRWWDGTKISPNDKTDTIYGNILCVGYDPKTEEDRGLSKEEIALCDATFSDKNVFYQYNYCSIFERLSHDLSKITVDLVMEDPSGWFTRYKTILSQKYACIEHDYEAYLIAQEAIRKLHPSDENLFPHLFIDYEISDFPLTQDELTDLENDYYKSQNIEIEEGK